MTVIKLYQMFQRFFLNLNVFSAFLVFSYCCPLFVLCFLSLFRIFVAVVYAFVQKLCGFLLLFACFGVCLLFFLCFFATFFARFYCFFVLSFLPLFCALLFVFVAFFVCLSCVVFFVAFVFFCFT